VPLRVIGICGNIAFFTYGVLGGLYPVIILHAVLLPVNVYRLHQMLRLTRDVREAASGELNIDWLKPYASQQQTRVGDIIFRKDDAAAAMFLVASGRFRLVESGIAIAPMQMVGELAFLSDRRQRTQTLECVEAGTLLKIGYRQIEQLYFQNPKFGFYLLKLIARRLFDNVERLEHDLAKYRHTPA
jgi:CRP-like cAMP-binding protein